MPKYADLRINAARFLNRMQEMARIGATPKGGVCRLAGSPEDAEGRQLLRRWTTELGWQEDVDAIGNQFARMEGTQPEASAILLGSHLDTQPTGGRFDGVLGVLAALEVMQSIHEAQIKPLRSIDLVNWTNEEGARFLPAMLGSGTYAGVFSLDEALNSTDPEGQRLGACLLQNGWRGESMSRREYAAAFELHIEQGPVLEAEKLPIGLVEGVQGIRWYSGCFKGQETHAGPCPMHLRADPVPAFAEFLQQAYHEIAQFGTEARITVGKIHTEPGSQNTVPSAVHFSIDLRHPKAEVLQTMHRWLQNLVSSTSKGEIQEIWHSPPISFDKNCISAIQNACEHLKLPYKKMFSGAGHDSVYVSRIAPTAMIFVPSKDGLSHNEAEFTADEELIAGVNVLLHAVIHTLERLNALPNHA